MSRIDDLIQELCPDGVEHKTLGGAGKFIRGSGLQKADLREEGVPAVHYGQIHTFYGVYATETKSFTDPVIAAKLRHAQPGDLLIATTSEDDDAVAKATAWLGDSDVVLSGDAYIYRHELDPKYMAYFFQSSSFQDQKRRFISGTKVRRVSGDSLEKIRIPVPPLEVQREIVRVLDKFTQLEAELEAELEARRAQYEHYRHEVLSSSNGAALTSVGEIVHGVSSGRNKSRSEGGAYPVYGSTGQIGTTNAPAYSGLALLIARVGANAGRVNIVDGEYDVSDNTLVVTPAEAWDVYYAYHQLTNMRLNQYAVGGGQPLVTGKLIKALKVALPDVDEQRRIAGVLDKFDALVNDISIGLPAELAARRKQYDHYRDRLLTFKEAA
ncbi:Type I restriction-modification system, specificity subunit S [Kocuria palustris PEL]|uniref:Type I restriction-modification system, specificity subunit S n=1 Tax=Kocuria palustris PEL TaxID=1236550 RepID=M2XFC3_9MICC|nr:restriction endonuclease subunit S [Kocuria palustris]EME37806.1 Type I restriction-modification system, specificity subunit S [Kocuria palustris PEL]